MQLEGILKENHLKARLERRQFCLREGRNSLEEKNRLEGKEEEKWLSIIHVIFPYQSLQMMNRCNKSQYSILSNLHGKKAIIYC